MYAKQRCLPLLLLLLLLPSETIHKRVRPSVRPSVRSTSRPTEFWDFFRKKTIDLFSTSYSLLVPHTILRIKAEVSYLWIEEKDRTSKVVVNLEHVPCPLLQFSKEIERKASKTEIKSSHKKGRGGCLFVCV